MPPALIARPSQSVPAAIPRVSAPRKGRGTDWEMPHRFSADQREVVDDGWGTLEQQAQEVALPPATRIIEERVKSILTGNDSPDINFDLSINPYRGCEHEMWNSSGGLGKGE